MFPEADTISNIVSDTVKILFRRRFVDRVLRYWTTGAPAGRFPRRDQIDPSVLGADWANCLVIAVRSPVELSYFDAVGENLAFVRSPSDSLAGVLLAHLSRVLTKRCYVTIEGRATLGGSGVLYRGALFPLSEDGVTIDHVLGTANYRLLRAHERQTHNISATKH